MTPHQFAIAAGSDSKWILNSAALLRRRVRHTNADARWWGLLRLLTESLGLPLQAAADAATSCLREGGSTGEVAALADPSGSASLRVDLRRYQSIFLVNLSRSLVQETPRRRGRPSRRPEGGAVDSARRYGVDLGLVEAALKRTPAERLEMLEANVGFIREMRHQRAEMRMGK
ncbi:MAG TPA: hypothetical protein VGQ98_09515 [Gemmatimonadaceae bacterium]|nr:hypothetical protein [Gemmatimonadaceae bacterium]